VIHFYGIIERFQAKAKVQLMHKKVRLDQLRKQYNEYFLDFKARIATSTKRVDKQLFSEFKNYNAIYADRLLVEYNERCKTRNKLAFF